MAVCKSCGAKIAWVRTPKGKLMPIDVEPEKRITLEKNPEGPEPLMVMVDTYTSHFATCPDANKHRKR